MKRLTTDDSVAEMLKHPAFQPFAKSLLPWDKMRQNSPDISLGMVGKLMPYHRHVDGEAVVAALNRMIADREEGKTIFYDVYSAEKKLEYQKASVGLFFFRGKPGAPFALVLPGGEFAYVASLHEGFPIANAISERGYNAFVLRYRTGSRSIAIGDMLVARKLILQNADEWEVAKGGYSAWGCSDGARIAAYLGSYAPWPKPAAVVMAYSKQLDFTRHDPPTFLVIGSEDKIVAPTMMRQRTESLQHVGIDAEFHEFSHLGHGFGLGKGTEAEGWVDDAVSFWEKFLPR